MWWLRVVSAGAVASRYLTTAGRTLRVTGSVSKTSSIFRTIWKGFDYLTTGYAIYEVVNWFAGDDNTDDDDRKNVLEYIMKNIVPTEVTMALSSTLNDPMMISLAFTNAGMTLLTDNDTSPSMKGMAYLACAQYILEYPTSSRRAFSDDEVSKYLTKEVTSILTDSTNATVSWMTSSTVSETDVKEAIDAIKIEGSPDNVVRYWDFVAYYLEAVAAVEVNNENQNSQT